MQKRTNAKPGLLKDKLERLPGGYHCKDSPMEGHLFASRNEARTHQMKQHQMFIHYSGARRFQA